MHLASGRAFTIPIFSCLVTLVLISNSPVGRTQNKSTPKSTNTPPSSEHIIEPVAQPTPPKGEASTSVSQKPTSEFGQGPVITNTDLITVTVTVTDTYGR